MTSSYGSSTEYTGRIPHIPYAKSDGSDGAPESVKPAPHEGSSGGPDSVAGSGDTGGLPDTNCKGETNEGESQENSDNRDSHKEEAPGKADSTETDKQEADRTDTGTTDTDETGTGKSTGGRTKRRRNRLRVALKLGIAMAVLLAFLGVGDRWAVLYAEDKSAEQVQHSLHLRAKPEVRIPGFPFLTQLATGRLDKADITITDAPGGRISVARAEGTARNVRLVGDSPLSVKGAVLGRTQGDVMLAFDDLDRELGTSQVKFRPGKRANTVLADGRLPVAGKTVQVRANAHLHRFGDRGVGTTVQDMRLNVPGLFSYTPGKDGGLRLARPLAERIRQDTAKAKALFQVGSVAKQFGLSQERAAKVRQSEEALHRLTGEPKFTDRLMRVNMVDVILQNPSLLKQVGIDPGLLNDLKKLNVPQLADRLSWSTRLPDSPGHVRVQRIAVTKEGIHAAVSSPGMKVGTG